MKSPKRKLAILDLETDPFEFNKVPQPFLAAFWDGRNTLTHWSANCVEQLVRTLEKEEPSLIYAHNGGRFDFHYFLPYLSTSKVKVINGSIAEARLGKHIIRDSYRILPFSLRKYDKLEIDPTKFHKDRREKHKDEIILYNHRDLTSLYELVSAFRADFGNTLTIGMAAIKELEKFHPFKRGNQYYDAYFRKFFFGGRVQVHGHAGITKGPIHIIDVNSMYPHAMASVKHPIGLGHTLDNRITKSTIFLVIEGTNNNAFPIRTKEGLDFESPYGVYHVTIHEFQAAIETGRFKVKRILKTYNWRELGTFDQFVHHYIAKRQSAIQSGDRIHDLLYKFLLNSSYGKFAQNPAKYFDWCFARDGEFPFEWHTCSEKCHPNPTTGMCRWKWYPASLEQDYFFYKRAANFHSYYNVATGASITGAARAMLLRALHQTPNWLYCDTDSIIYRGETGAAPIHPTDLGAWKQEGSGDSIAIAGKKMYALFDEARVVKMAHKGAFHPSPTEIVRMARGEAVVNQNPVPKFHLSGPPTFTTRVLRATA